jgi:hypothetical protein
MLAFSDIPNGLNALSKSFGAGWRQTFLFALFIETVWFKYDPSRAPGDYEKAGILRVPNDSTLPAGKEKIANGRLAMVAIIGMFYQDGLTGSAWCDWAFYTDSPLRAFEDELGVQALLGFMDPMRGAAATVEAVGYNLIGEELVQDDESASKLAAECIEEAQELLFSTRGWRKVLDAEGVLVEVSDVKGAYEESGVHLVRAAGEMPCSAEEFTNFQVSKEGMAATDEYLQNHRNVAKYRWLQHPTVGAKEGSLEVNRVEWRYPFKVREFVSMDFYDPNTGIFISKSCLHPERAGGSKYQTLMPLNEQESVRAVQYYAVKAEPVSETSCRVDMVTWGHMCDSYDPMWVNEFNARLFVVPKFQRFRACMWKRKEGADDSEVAAFLEKECSRNIQDVAWDLLKVAPGLAAKVLLSDVDRSSDFIKKFSKMKAVTQSLA